MNYYIRRDEQQFGPYTLADLQRYVASGNILVTDLTRSEGMTDWVPVSQVIGNIPVPVAPATASPVSIGSDYPNPPSLHWAAAVAIGIVTCGLFGWIWVFVQAAWVRKVQSQAKCIIYFGIGLGLLAGSMLFSMMGGNLAAFGGLLNLAGAVLWIVGAFSMKSSIEEHYNSAEPVGLSLSGVMTFFFNIYYFQYHFTRINEMKRSGQLAQTQLV